jgi:hypothetical protein
MRRAATAALLLAALSMGTPWVSAQEKSKSSEDAATETHQTETTPLKVSIIFTEFEGDKKVKSLPYTTIVIADGKNPKSVVKMGSRVPVYAGKDIMQYLDVGSNIDCQASRTKDNKFDLRLSLDRSWVEGSVAIPTDAGAASQTSGQFPEPIVRQFRSELSLTLRDGQTIESSFATDPLSGKVFRVEVSLNVVK